MDVIAANRIIDLAMKWANPIEWELKFKQAESFKTEKENSSRHWETFYSFLKPFRKKPTLSEEFSACFKRAIKSPSGDSVKQAHHHAVYSDELAEMAHKSVIDGHRELTELANLIRQHFPNLTEHIPPEVNLLEIYQVPEAHLRDLRRIEGTVRCALIETNEPDIKDWQSPDGSSATNTDGYLSVELNDDANSIKRGDRIPQDLTSHQFKLFKFLWKHGSDGATSEQLDNYIELIGREKDARKQAICELKNPLRVLDLTISNAQKTKRYTLLENGQ